MGKKSYVRFIKGEKRIEELTSEELAYLAGVIDACGALELDRRLEPQLRIEKRSDLPKLIALKIGGYLRYRKPNKGNQYYRYALALRGEILRDLVARIKPLLRTNKREIGISLLLQAFEAEDLETLHGINRQLRKREMNRRLGEFVRKDSSWFFSYEQ